MNLRKHKLKLFIALNKNKKIIRNPPSIISNDCWGGEICKILSIPFQSPFVGLMIMAPDYIKLLENFSFYISKELFFTSNSKYQKFQKVNYPIALLNRDVEIHFMHYKTEEEATEKWKRRVERIDSSNLFIKFDGSKDFADKDLLKRFLDLDFKNKICFSSEKNNFENDCLLFIPTWDENAVKMAYRTYKYFNMKSWFKNKMKNTTIIQKIYYKLLLAKI